MKHLMLPLAAAFLLLPIIGCGNSNRGPRTVPASGILTLDGVPVEGAAVAFVQQDQGKHFAQGYTDAEGKFSLNAFEYKTGAVPGEYMVSIQKTVVEVAKAQPGSEESEHEGEGEGAGETVRNVLPPRYTTPTKDFMFTVPEDGTDSLKIELTTK